MTIAKFQDLKLGAVVFLPTGEKAYVQRKEDNQIFIARQGVEERFPTSFYAAEFDERGFTTA